MTDTSKNVPSEQGKTETSARAPKLVNALRITGDIRSRVLIAMPSKSLETADEKKTVVEFMKEASKGYAALVDLHPNVAATVVEDILKACRATPGALEAAHGSLAYVDDKRLYRAMLEKGKPDEGFSRKCQNFLANLRRREWDLDGAMAEYVDLLKFVESQEKIEGLPGKGVIKYEIGYIKYLQGALPEAITYFRDSADDDAKVPGREIGSFISRSLQYLAERTAGTKDVSEMRAFFENAEKIFMEKGATDPIAKRWVMNARVHLLETVLEQGETERAEELMNLLRADPWIEENNTTASKEILLRCEAPLALLKGDAEGALKYLKELVPNIENIEQAKSDEREAVARHYLNAGWAYEELGQADTAKKIWAYALTLSENHGNKPWQAKIREKMTDLA